MRRCDARYALLLLVLLLCPLVGCKWNLFDLDERVVVCGKYNDNTDIFSLLFVHTHLEANNEEAIQRLVKCWESREQVIPLFGCHFFALRRVSTDSYRQIGDGLEGSDLLTSSVPLDEITITPGNFFLGPDNTLSYTHRIDFPGRVLDRLLALGEVEIRSQLKRSVERELQRRRDGGAVVSWDAIRSEILRQLETDPTEAGQPATATNLQLPSFERCLSETSLKKLLDAAGGKLGPRRSGKVVSLTYPVAEDDGEQLVALGDLLRDKRFKKRMENEFLFKLFRLSTESLSITKARGEGVTISFQLPLPINQLPLLVTVEEPKPADEQKKEEAVRPTTKDKQQATLVAIETKHKLPVLKDVTVNELLAHFGAEDYRLWRTKDGAFQVKALFLDRDNSSVRLRRQDNGKEKVVPISKLSEEDQQYLQSRK